MARHGDHQGLEVTGNHGDHGDRHGLGLLMLEVIDGCCDNDGYTLISLITGIING